MKVLISALRDTPGGNATYVKELIRHLSRIDDIELIVSAIFGSESYWRKISPSIKIRTATNPSSKLFFISENHFLRLFPSASGYNQFLIDLERGTEIQDAMGQLQRILRPNGVIIKRSIDTLVEFFSVENTYVSIFFQLFQSFDVYGYH